MRELSDLSIRPFDAGSDADYQTLVAIRNAVMPEYATTVAALKDEDDLRDPKCLQARWIAERGGQAVGCGSYSQSPWAYHPRRFYVGVSVLPDREGQGIGGALYAHIVAALEPFSPIALDASVREDMTRAHRFALDRGFVEEMREWESRLDVRTFDPTPWRDARDRPLRHGISVHTLRDLERDPERDRKLWALESETFLDVPSNVELTPPAFDSFRRSVLKSLNLLPDAFFIAVDEASGRYVGSSALWKSPAADHLNTGLTGVLRAYRRRGIALAMKLRAIDYARSVGAPEIRTENASTNRPMLSINEALGFVKQPAWIYLAKKTASDGVRVAEAAMDAVAA